MATTIPRIDELRLAGLLNEEEIPHLTEKGRDWLRLLADAEMHEVTEAGEGAVDLILSTNGLFR